MPEHLKDMADEILREIPSHVKTSHLGILFHRLQSGLTRLDSDADNSAEEIGELEQKVEELETLLERYRETFRMIQGGLDELAIDE